MRQANETLLDASAHQGGRTDGAGWVGEREGLWGVVVRRPVATWADASEWCMCVSPRFDPIGVICGGFVSSLAPQ